MLRYRRIRSPNLLLGEIVSAQVGVVPPESVCILWSVTHSCTWPVRGGLARVNEVSVSAVVTIAASVAAVIGVVVGGWQLRVQILDRRDAKSMRSLDRLEYVTGAFPVAPPFGRLPHRVRGRDKLVRELHKALRRKRGGVWVLSGMGGIGKSTVALQAARMARARGWQGVHSRGAGNWRQLMAGSGGSQGLPAMALAMASSAVMPWAAAESR